MQGNKMNYRPEDWNNPHPSIDIDYQWNHYGGRNEKILVANPLHHEFETGADAILEALLPLLRLVRAQLCSMRLKESKIDCHLLDTNLDTSINKLINISSLDNSIDKLEAIIRPKEDASDTDN